MFVSAMNKFESINVGDNADLSHVISQSDIDMFVELTGDDNKLHVDKEYASRTSVKKPVVHGMLGASFISTVIGTKLPGDGALWYAQNLEFLRPVRVGDEITIRVEVIKKVERTQTIELSTEIYNQNRQKVTTGTAKVKIVEQAQLVTEDLDQNSTSRVALVVGGSGGIGQATCLQLAKDGFDVAIHYLENRKSAEEIRDRIRRLGKKAITIHGDIGDFSLVEAMVEETIRKLATITVVVNAATLDVPNIKFSNLQWEVIENHFNLNVRGAFNIVKCVLPVMEKANFGKIINVTTQYVDNPKPELAHYITAKSGISGFSKALAVELAPKGIRINLVSPGMTDTELIADVPDNIRLLTAAQTPLKRIATPNDIAGAVSFLASEKSDFLTGETIRVNGGQLLL